MPVTDSTGQTVLKLEKVPQKEVIAYRDHRMLATWLSRDDLSGLGAYRAFLAGMLIWAWHELGFYSGVLGGGAVARPP